ncbi:translesion DNA synthesis-associated protein ImuA [Shewanella khirikhana]|uniref:translesion DNA synthesis-associated protein ImuA n=1 Tax=Shewanella khirikhana TaxID=1965282 RepID=UPI0030D3DD11
MKTSPQELSKQLGRQDIWLGQQTCQQPGYATGFEALDTALPDSGWPRHGVCELSCPVPGSQSMLLLTPLLRCIQGENDTPVILVGAPWQLNPQYLLQHGLRPEGFCLVDVNARKDRLWAMEQSLASGGCRLLLGWLDRLSLTEARRLQLAAEKGGCLAIILVTDATEGNPLPLRLGLTPGGNSDRLELALLKRRGGKPQDSLQIEGLSPLLARYLPPQPSVQVVQGPWGGA